jgi:hypothetical protein
MTRRRSSRLLFLLLSLTFCVQAHAALQDEPEGETKDRGEIRFPKGRTSTLVRGRLGRNVRDQYLVRARAGQLMTVSLESNDPQLGFDVFVTTGLEALPVTPADELQTAWSGKLPAGDEYYINVLSKGAGGDYSFELKIENAQARSAKNRAEASNPGAVAREFRAILREIKREAGAPVLLPAELPASVTSRRLYVEGDGDTTGYSITLTSRPRCGANSCMIGFFSAKRTEALSEDYERVSLAGGIVGAYKPLTCGGSCSPPMIEWEYEGALYTIQLSLDGGDEARDRQTLIALANSAISAGPR